MDFKGFVPAPENQIIFIKRTASFFFLIGMLLSFNLWRSDRLFPVAPALDLFPKIPSPLDLILPGLLLLALAVNCFSRKKIINHLALLLVFLLAIQDQNRWQPWVYIYTLCQLPFSFFRPDEISKAKTLAYFHLLLERHT
ncbi:hypothetical protein [Adhaeribacter terreus]|uniref:Uncharacterized protein n=1 Tax=Adhaeribacter terreus TaxID=529703 RepID=A0ABW0E9Y1_9BACT